MTEQYFWTFIMVDHDMGTDEVLPPVLVYSTREIAERELWRELEPFEFDSMPDLGDWGSVDHPVFGFRLDTLEVRLYRVRVAE